MFIGPNGSGKSNVCDALCFVLGKSSAKDMRAEKSSNLIFNGGKKGKAASEAEVSITFDNSSNLFPIQSKEVTISRIVKPNGNSIYKINKEVHTRQQVRDLLTGARLDPDGHNIIMQGDIIGFMEMKPVERRMVIEEIAGISAYEEKKQKCLQELTKVDTKLNEAEIILKEREANLRELKKDRDQAVQYKELQDALQSDKATFVHLQIKDKETKVNEIESRKKEAESKVTKLQEELAGSKQKIADLKAEINTITQELDAKGEKDQIILRKNIEELKETAIKSASRLELVRTELEKLKARKTALQQDIISIQTKVQDVLTQKKTFEAKAKQLTAEKTALEQQIAKFKEKNGFDQDASKNLDAIEKELETLQTTLNTLQEQKQDFLRKHDQSTYKLTACDERINALSGNSDKESLAIVKKNKARLKELDIHISKTANEDSSLASQLNSARSESSSVTNELAKLKGRHLSIMERSSSDSALARLLDKKNSIKGILGTVASLGNVDSQYSLALEIAAGGRLHSIVVDTDVTAQRCIQHLKENKLGVATFLPLNKVKSRVMDDTTKKVLDDKKGVHGLAIDLVTYDKKLANVFSYVFGTTIVVDDIETARRIGIGRARMVTLNGDLLEPSGAMIGGFRARAGIGFLEKDTTERMQTLEEQLSTIHTLIDHLEHKRVTNEEQLRSYRHERAGLEGETLKLERSLGIDINQLPALEEEKKTLQHEIETFQKEMNHIEETIKKEHSTLEQLKSKRTKLREKLSNPELAQNLETFETQRAKLVETLADINSQIKGLDIQHLSILLPELEKAEKIIKQQDKEHETFLKEEKDLTDILKAREQELKSKENEERKFFSNLRDLALKRTKLNEKIQAFETTNASAEERQRSHEQRLNGITIERAKAVAELEGLQHEFSQYHDVKLVRGMQLEDLKARIHTTEHDIAKIGNVNLRALEVYEDIQKEHGILVEKVTVIRKEKDDVLMVMHEVESQKAAVFMKTYNAIIGNFKTIYANLTTKGGEAHVELENPQDPFAGGMDIQIKIANNKSLDMKSLSGGEKTMAALAFIFAIQEHSPSPFYLLDEVDAALDKRNSEMLSKLIQQYAQKAQYIVVSHNDSVITEADQIYGVSMQQGISKVISLKV